jgi:hypothetical protein
MDMGDQIMRDQTSLFVESAWARLKEACAVLTAIDYGELLSAAPEAADARRRHYTAICLLTVMQRDLTSLALEFEALDHRFVVN